jgi:tetratricopeptide (TPR) repeat protein
MSRRRRKFEYDAAISFAGEQRHIAEKLANILKAKGLSVFYDAHYSSYIWGKNQEELERIYGPASRYFVPLISADYLKKDWCRLEFQVAKEEAKKRKEEFILPIRLDDSRILGLREDVFYKDLRHCSISKIAENLLEKIKSAKLPEAKYQAPRNPKVRILTHSSRKVLGIIAVCPFPLHLQHFERIFPKIGWKREVRLFRRNGILEKGRGPLRIPESVKQTLLSNREDAVTFSQAWIEALEPLKHHTDIALNLALQYIALKQFNEAITILANIAEGLEPNWWNSLYLTIFKTIYDNRLLRRLKPEARARFYNAMGLCLSRIGENEQAVKWFVKLRRYSKYTGNPWGLGQSYINCGVAYYRIGDIGKAERCYRKGIEYAKGRNDRRLLSRSLNNLAMTIADRDIDESKQLLDESLALKECEEDQVGLLGTFMGYGYLAAQKGEFLQAIKWYRKAEKKARAYELQYDLALVLSNLGSAHADLGKFQEAFSYYRESRKIAKKEDFPDALAIAVQGEAVVRVRNEEFVKAETLFSKLSRLKKHLEDTEGEIIALHDIGITLIKQGKRSQARRSLSKALKLARENQNLEWIYRCHVNRAFSYAENGNMGKEISALKRAAAQEQNSGLYIVAAKLWETCANRLIYKEAQAYEIESAFLKSVECMNKASNAYHQILNLYKLLFLWRWSNGFFSAAIQALEEIEKASAIHRQIKDRINAIDQKGVCLQNLMKFKEAEKVHREALKLARCVGDEECIETSLNNLGELLRKTGRLKQAVTILTEAETIARSHKNVAAEIGIAHNRALALEDLRKIKQSKKLLRKCRDVARQHRLRDEYVRALHALANLAWKEGKDRLAERRYAKALAEANSRELSEMKCAISLNYSRLLRSKNRLGEAFQILHALQDEFVTLANSYLYYMALAELYDEFKELKSAKSNWQKAKEAAMRVGERTTVAISSAALAQIYKKEHKWKLADNEIQDSFRNEDDQEGKVLILLQRINILLDAKKAKRAEKIFDQARTIIEKHEFREAYIDLHMAFGDYYWAQRPRSQFGAMQAYIAAMAKAIELDIDTFFKVGLHIFKQLFAIEPKIRMSRINLLYKRLSAWLRKQIEIIDDDLIIERTLWPLRVARRVSLALEEGHKLSDREITEMAKSELGILLKN